MDLSEDSESDSEEFVSNKELKKNIKMVKKELRTQTSLVRRLQEANLILQTSK